MKGDGGDEWRTTSLWCAYVLYGVVVGKREEDETKKHINNLSSAERNFSDDATRYHHGNRSLPFTSSCKTKFDECRRELFDAAFEYHRDNRSSCARRLEQQTFVSVQRLISVFYCMYNGLARCCGDEDTGKTIISAGYITKT
jgi:hypothetical protein